MTFLAIGINHNTASVDIREKVSFAPETMSESLSAVKSLPGIHETVILSTCNRSEIYCQTDDVSMSSIALLKWLADSHHLDIEELKACSYIHTDTHAIDHLSKVACGLDSMVLGEPQILGQLKSAYAVAKEYHSVGSLLNFAFQHSFKVAKQVRTQTAIGENAVSVAFAAVSLATRIFDDLSQCRALLVGAGETIDLVARHLRDKGLHQITVANRTLARAESLAKEFNARACLLSDIPEELPKADIVISSTASQLPIIGKGVVERALKLRKYRPVFMVDIAVPRDIEHEVGDLDDVFLYTVDDLRSVIEDNRRSRQRAAEQAEQIISQQTLEFVEQLKTRAASDVIRSIRSKAELIKQAEIDRALNALLGGADAQEVVQQLAHNLTNKIMHGPTIAVKNAVASGDKTAAEWAFKLFDVDQ